MTEEQVPPPQGGEERPTYLPEKFRTPEDMAKAYSELEKRMGSQAVPAEKRAPETPAPPEAAPEQPIAEVPPVAGERPESLEIKVPEVGEHAGKITQDQLNEFVEEWQQHQKLGDESYAKLEKLGLDRSVVDDYISGKQAQAALFEQQLDQTLSMVGGAESYDQMVQWASQNLPPAEIAMFNEDVSSNDLAKVQRAVRDLSNQWRQSGGGPQGKQIAGFTGGETGDFYESIAQMKADMSDPRYKTDPAFRAKVAQKIQRRSPFKHGVRN